MRDDTPNSLVRLLEGLIDYAGLFPPAALSMRDAVAQYARYRQGPHAWALGRFIVPAAHLQEFGRAFENERRAAWEDSPWPLSVLADLPVDPVLDRIAWFAEAVPGARVESIECKVAGREDLESLAPAALAFEVFAEMPLWPVPTAWLGAARDLGCAAKIRTGGITPEAFPPPATVAAFLAASIARGVPFKATAGLHHALRSSHPVTYEPGAPRATMHGFLNVFLAAVLLSAGAAGQEDVEQLLAEGDASAFTFEDARAGWRDRWVAAADIERARRLARSFGSCSFEEPVGDLTALALLHSTT